MAASLGVFMEEIILAAVEGDHDSREIAMKKVGAAVLSYNRATAPQLCLHYSTKHNYWWNAIYKVAMTERVGKN